MTDVKRKTVSGEEGEKKMNAVKKDEVRKFMNEGSTGDRHMMSDPITSDPKFRPPDDPQITSDPSIKPPTKPDK